MKMVLAVLNKNGENAVPAVSAALSALYAGEDVCFGVATPSNLTLTEDLDKPSANAAKSPIAVGYLASTALPKDEPQVVRLENSTIVFDGITYEPHEKTLALEVFAKKLKNNCLDLAGDFVAGVEGDFALIIAEQGRLVSTRDPVGVQPLFYGENDSYAALASNRKSLWKLGLAEPKSFPPGHVAVTTADGFAFKAVKTLPYQEPKPISMSDAAQTLQTLLERSIKRRIFGVKKVAVAFSGGLDSSLVAFLAHKCGVEVELVHVSLEDQPETGEAVRAAEELDLPLQVHLFKEADIERDLPAVVGLIEAPDPVKAGVGVPFYWAAQKTAEAGFKVLLAGQGADELFGGYQRYVTEYLAQGDEKVRRTMYHDVANVHESNLERDEKICIHHDVELRLPFASFELAQFAMSLPTELKFECKADSSRKLVLRRVAGNVGLSKAVADKPKKAVQYSTGISNALKRIAKKRGLSLGEYVNQVFLVTKSSTHDK